MRQIITRGLLPITVILITALLITNILLTLRNNEIIEDNRQRQKQAEQIKVTVSQFGIIIIHNLDLGLRGYALFKQEKYLFPMKFAIEDKDSLINLVEEALAQQDYPRADLDELRDSINAYVAQCSLMLELFRADKIEEFNRLADLDKGYHLWLQYERFTRKVYRFEDDINEVATRQYKAAMVRNYLIQIILFLICVPTLIFTATHTRKKLEFEHRLTALEKEKSSFLASQNRLLEQTVQERTAEIQSKNRMLQSNNEEITAQNEEITAQNEELNRHREELFTQNKLLIDSKKEQLEFYTQTLKEKSEMITTIGEELEVLRRQFSPPPEHIAKFNEILQFSLLTDEDWERFKKKFQDVYPTFFANIRYKFPEITASELRLSALIKLNLSMKESAAMLGISTSSVKKSRYRLKKRLGLKDEASLEDFIQGGQE